MSQDAVRSRKEGAVTLLTPSVAAGAAPAELLEALRGALASAHEDETCAAIVLELLGDPCLSLEDAEPSLVVEHARAVQELCDRLLRGGKPSIAAVRGTLTAAGFDLALSCHLIFAADDAALGAGGAARGRLDGFGGMAQLLRRAGPGRAAWLALQSEAIEAGRLLGWAVVDQVSAAGDCLADALSFGARCAEHEPAIVEALLEELAVAGDLPLDDALELEAQLAGLAAARGGRD